jgi:hypothetical protein
MQCVNCGFENIPGMRACVRCQSSLALEDVVVAPPRASRYRVGTGLRQCWNVVKATLAPLPHALSGWGRGAPDEYGIRWEAVFASIVPGLGQIRYGHKATGRFLLAAWVGLMLGALVTWGQDSSQLFLTGAVGVHAAGVMPFLSPLVINSNLLIRMLFGLLVFAGLRLGIYFPAGLLSEQFFWPFRVAGLADGPIVQNDDVLLCPGPWAPSPALHRGDLVVYAIPDIRRGNIWVGRGYGLDRIVGLPGDHVQIVKGQLLVNGRAVVPELAPLGPVDAWEGLSTSGGDRYVILPTRLPSQVHGVVNQAPVIEAMSRVPRTAILGKVALRIQPWSRLGGVQ